MSCELIGISNISIPKFFIVIIWCFALILLSIAKYKYSLYSDYCRYTNNQMLKRGLKQKACYSFLQIMFSRVESRKTHLHRILIAIAIIMAAIGITLGYFIQSDLRLAFLNVVIFGLSFLKIMHLIIDSNSQYNRFVIKHTLSNDMELDVL